MRDHHWEALEFAVKEVADDDGFLACLLTGSVARGWERPDSDLDDYPEQDGKKVWLSENKIQQLLETAKGGEATGRDGDRGNY